MHDWMIYGATGYTGKLVAEEAVQRGHKPLLAGRSPEKLKALAQALNLDYVVAPIDDAAALENAVRQVRVVYHAAGPFMVTSERMVAACLSAGAHYLDINGELPVYQSVFRQDAAAQARGVALISGAGFDIVPSDCLAKYVADQLPDATELVTVIGASGGAGGGFSVSAGTAKTELEMIRTTGFARRENGRLVGITPGAGMRRFPFPSGDRAGLPVPWGDLETSYRSTGIPNITSYILLPPLAIRALRLTHGLLFGLLKVPAVHAAATRLVDRFVTGPDATTRQQARTLLYAEVRNPGGERRQAWLETLEAYQFTKVVAVRAVEHLLEGKHRGALTPAQAFGADFVLEIESTQRWDRLPS